MTENESHKESLVDYKNALDRETLLRILDNSYDEIFVTDGKGITIYVNQACERNYGVKPEELIGQSPGQMATEGYCFPQITPIILRDKKRVTLEQRTITGRRIVTTATPVFDDEGNMQLMIQNVRDISQIDQIKHDLEETQKLLEKYKQEIKELRKRDQEVPSFIAHSKQMKDVLELTQIVAPTDSNILILGESGTGKGVIAKYIHKISKGEKCPFITINCAAIPEELLESELFGYVPGAFTGANKDGKLGLIELANEGTLFLDEIAELPLRLQAKLLHVIQEHQFSPVGGTERKLMKCRVIAATNRNLEEMVAAGKFREDLYYRLNVIEMEIPPLRERPDDILPLIYFFLNQFDQKYQREHYFSQAILDKLGQYSWPGNIRELEHLIERLVVTIREPEVELHHLPKPFNKLSEAKPDSLPSSDSPLDLVLEQVEKKLITKTYKKLGSSRKVAKALEISPSKAARLIKKYCDVPTS